MSGLARVLAVLLLLTGLMAMSPSSWARGRESSSPRPCDATLKVFSAGFGSPDDIGVLKKLVFFGDGKTGEVGRVEKGAPVRELSALKVPEGIVVESPTRIVVAEQGIDRVVSFNLARHTHHKLMQLHNLTTEPGIEGIAPAPNGAIFVPDSPNGVVYLLHPNGKYHELATGFTRPVSAVAFKGGVAVADEKAGTVSLIRKGQVHILRHVPEPSRLAVIDGALVSTTLGDGGLWEIEPHRYRMLYGFGLPAGLAPYGTRSLLLSDSVNDRIYRLVHIYSCLWLS